MGSIPILATHTFFNKKGRFKYRPFLLLLLLYQLSKFPGKFKVFKTQALDMPGIKSVTRMLQNLTQIIPKTGGVDWEEKILIRILNLLVIASPLAWLVMNN